MTGGGVSDYLQDVEYPSFFHAFQLPAQLCFACADSHPPDRAFQYLDLACGSGRTLLGMAAAYPAARFLGIDASAAHVAAARDAAGRAGLTNVEFLELDVEHAATRLGGERFDFISMVGAYPWLAQRTREAVHALAGRRLRPAGKLLLHYSSIPGAVQHQALFTLLQAMAASAPAASSEAGMATGLQAALSLREAGARFFQQQPMAARRLDGMQGQPLAYLAHECLNRHYRPVAHAALAADLALHGLHFAGQALPLLNEPQLLLTPALAEQVGRHPPGPARQTALDFALDLGARHDVFVRGPAQPEPGLPSAWAFVCTRPRALLPATHRFPSGQRIDLGAAPWRGMLDRLAGGAVSFDVLADGHGGGHAEAARVLRMLIAAGLVEACLPATPQAEADGQPAGAAGPAPLAALAPDRLQAAGAELAVPGHGVVVALNGLDLACLSALSHQPPARAVRWLAQHVKGLGFELPVPAVSAPTPAQRRAYLGQRLQAVQTHWLPKLRALGLWA